MSLIKCPECTSEISDQAYSCPSCGFPLKKENIENHNEIIEEEVEEDEYNLSWQEYSIKYKISEDAIDKLIATGYLKAKVNTKGIYVKDRPPTGVNFKNEIINDMWNGYLDLWMAYWVFGVFLGGVLVFILVLLFGKAGALLFLPYNIWVTVSIWRCAPNTEWLGWTYIARILSVFGALSVFSVFAN